MTHARFAPHGQFDMGWCGDVLYSELHGMFNVQAMQQYITQLQALGAARNTRWGRLAQMQQWEGMTPDAAALFESFTAWIRGTQCKVSVQLLPTSFQKTIAAHAAQRLRADRLHQVTTATDALQVFAHYQLDCSGLAARLALPPAPASAP